MSENEQRSCQSGEPARISQQFQSRLQDAGGIRYGNHLASRRDHGRLDENFIDGSAVMRSVGPQARLIPALRAEL